MNIKCTKILLDKLKIDTKNIKTNKALEFGSSDKKFREFLELE
jgi:hypothetical protein